MSERPAQWAGTVGQHSGIAPVETSARDQDSFTCVPGAIYLTEAG